MPTPPKDSNHADDFLAAAKRQQKIEDHVKAYGEDARAALERQAVLDQGGAAAERLLEQERKEQALQRIVAFADQEIAKIIDTLKALPADSDGRSFVIKRDNDQAMGGSVTFYCHYATADEAKEGFTFAKEDTAAFRLFFSGSIINDDAPPSIYFYDYSRMIKDGKTYPDPTRTEAADGADLRAIVGSFVARMAAHRLEDIATAMLPPEAQQTPALSQDMPLRAPRIHLQKRRAGPQ